MKFIIDLKQKNINPKNEYEISENLYNKRKEGINFFRNSFDYISAFDSNAAIVHYKPNPKKSNATKDEIYPTIAKGAYEMTGVKALGRICLNITRRLFAPIDIAADT